MPESNSASNHESNCGAIPGSSPEVNRLIPLIYDELRRIAARFLVTERAGHTLQPTELVHEAYLQLASSASDAWTDDDHFAAAATSVLRRVLVQHARKRNRLKRGGNWKRIPLDTSAVGIGADTTNLVELDEALRRLGKLDPVKEWVVELRLYSGLPMDRIARILGTSPRSVARHWRLARAWLRVQLDEVDASDE
jgi:RNA polymerase sigma factor (TIGR02999 family)